MPPRRGRGRGRRQQTPRAASRNSSSGTWVVAPENEPGANLVRTEAEVHEVPPDVDEVAEAPREGSNGADRPATPVRPIEGRNQPAMIADSRAGSQITVSSAATRRRRLEMAAAEQRAKIRRRAAEERERIEIQLVDERLAAEILSGESEMAGGGRGSGRSAHSVDAWVTSGLAHPEEPAAPPPVDEYPVTSSPVPGAADITRLTQAITETLEVVRDASANQGTNRLVNRLTAKMSLPTFKGDSLEWLRFKRAFEVSTDMGGYSERENIARLYECLEGEAKDTVASLMMTASNAEQIMHTLELRFGNPDVILRKIVHDIKALPKLNSGRLDITALATKVKNAVAAMETMNHVGYLHSPELAQEVIGKMTSAMIYHYNRFVGENENKDEPRMTTIARFLYREAELACKAGTVCISTTEEKKSGQDNKDKRGGRGRRDKPAPVYTLDSPGRGKVTKQKEQKKSDKSKPQQERGDIKDMFLRIKIQEKDREAQRFLWRGRDRSQTPDTYHMTSMIFGAKSSPCTAIFIRNRNAREYESSMPLGAKAITKKCYMDDYLDSADSEEEAITLIQQVTKINEAGGFEMHKWVSNSQTVLNSVPEGKHAKGSVDLSLTDKEGEYSEKTLGLKWTPGTDTFTFEIGANKIPTQIRNGRKRPSKREMLRVIMSLFDPLGFLTPFTIRSKILLQNTWRSGIGWDEELKEEENEDWRQWVEDLAHLKECTIPRCYLDQATVTDKIELHTFCDASEKAYAAVAYWRIQQGDGTATVKFIAGKSRVAPLKPISIPRLELQAALLASRLAQTIVAEHEFQIKSRTFWTDSRTVMSWINSDPRNYKAYVSHRLGEIDELTDVREWKWVPTKDNAADDATRDDRSKLTHEARWFQGPPFLREPESVWPEQPPMRKQDNGTAESNDNETKFVATQDEDPGTCLPNIERFSSWRRLIRSTAWVLYFVELCQRKRRTGLTAQHLKRAEVLWIRQVQADDFKAEKRALEEGRAIDKSSRLLQLTPARDQDGVLRVQSRTAKVKGVTIAAKFPAILSGQHPYTRMLVQDYHQRMGHGSHETVINELRQKHWILSLRPTVRKVASCCLQCRRRRASAQPPRMADLPQARVGHHHRPFSFCGMDYFGPMTVTIGRRHEKRWGVLFTCLTTRAVHLELAASLTTDSAIMALRRMAARRGHPAELYSDNGTNLRGAEAEMVRALLEIDTEKQAQYATNTGFVWKFIPPAAPHMGGSWERMVRSVKVALKATLKERAPKEEVLTTLLAEAEHVVNSRPLTHVSVDHRDQEALTPNHFLIGASSGSAVPGEFDAGDLCSKKQWRVAQRLTDQFWRRWVKEYLPTLAPRRRWNQEVQPLRKGDIVVIVDSGLPRSTWPMGVIERTYPGEDGRVRVADVRTSRGILTRPATKIIAWMTDA